MSIADNPVQPRALLRTACSDVHERLDARLSQYDFGSRASYADMLSRMSGPVSALEGALSAGIAPAIFQNWAGRLRSHVLRQDIDAVGGSFRRMSAAPIENEAEMFGSLYVLEGSRLGGQVLARLAAESGDPAVQGARRYFEHGAPGSLWRSFVMALESSHAVQSDMRRTESAALRAFETFEAAFA